MQIITKIRLLNGKKKQISSDVDLGTDIVVRRKKWGGMESGSMIQGTVQFVNEPQGWEYLSI